MTEIEPQSSYGDIEHAVHEEIIMGPDSGGPAEIKAATAALLSGRGPEDIFAVRRLARGFDAAIKGELRRKDGDMVEVIKIQSAVLEALTDWLKRHGVRL
jgi:hypothetical protein